MGSNPSQPYFYLEGIIMSDSNQEAELFFKDLFDFSDVPLYDFIRKYSAINLILLIRHCGYDRKTLAKELKMKPKHLNKILSGDRNLSLKDINKISDHLGYTFDIVFHNKDYPNPTQPWQIDKELSSNTLT